MTDTPMIDQPTPDNVTPFAKPKTPQEIQQIKGMLSNALRHHYEQFIGVIKKFPGDIKHLMEAFEHFDAGFLTMNKAVILANPHELPSIQMAQVPQPQANAQQVTPEAPSQAPEAPTPPAA